MSKKKSMDADLEARVRRKTSEVFLDELRRKAPASVVMKYEALETKMAEGEAGFTAAEVLAHKVMSRAIDPDTNNKWAIEMILDRTEGKPVSAEKKSDEGRHIEERLDNITKGYLNEMAEGSYSAMKDKPKEDLKKLTKAKEGSTEDAEKAKAVTPDSVPAEGVEDASLPDPGDTTKNPLQGGSS